MNDKEFISSIMLDVVKDLFELYPMLEDHIVNLAAFGGEFAWLEDICKSGKEYTLNLNDFKNTKDKNIQKITDAIEFLNKQIVNIVEFNTKK